MLVILTKLIIFYKIDFLKVKQPLKVCPTSPISKTFNFILYSIGGVKSEMYSNLPFPLTSKTGFQVKHLITVHIG